ncbi:DUF971 domain-containing protein [Anaerolineales bacterium HSG6]|nr:DUF971 domain-containing protein [Anaerolineales bacterium HSG6]MDM8531811.1 DUF971 domain-containing protein [Anaerolineales bacterium HSG25]
MSVEQTIPDNIEIDVKQSQVRINWQDGLQTEYPFTGLRKACPCAECEALRKNDDPLRIFQPEQAITEGVLRPYNPAQMVGNYALQFFWADGHSAGIYTFKFLRKISGQ